MSDPGAADPGARVSAQWARWRATVDLEEYATRWHRLEAEGIARHGEADLVAPLALACTPPGERAAVLDAGCGMGRLAVELHRRGCEVVGVDLDPDMVGYARAEVPEVDWHVADLAAFDLGRTFSVVAMAGNVPVFCRRDDLPDLVRCTAAHVRRGGALVAGFSLVMEGSGVTLDEWVQWCAEAGLVTERVLATWEGDPYVGGDYAVVISRRP
jgi:SAM-dependent methyltransferase